MEKLKPEWLQKLFLCSETLFLADEKSKKIVWTSDPSVTCGTPCYKAFFGKDAPCEFCPKLAENEFYQWDYYDDREKRWLKVKYSVFDDGGRILRAGNFNAINDAMRLSHDSVEQISELQILLDENKRIKNALEREATHDRMTGLANRNRFNLDSASGMFDKPGVGVLYFDLNNLKEVNDKFRHEAGDRLIICLADAISATSEKFPGTNAYRVGGDEFVLMFTGCTEEILRSAHEYFDSEIKKTKLDPPCIVAVGEAFAKSGCDSKKLVSAADFSMYADKQRLKGIKSGK